MIAGPQLDLVPPANVENAEGEPAATPCQYDFAAARLLTCQAHPRGGHRVYLLDARRRTVLRELYERGFLKGAALVEAER